MSEERGGGSVSTRWTRVGSPLATQRHQSLCSDRSFLRRDYQAKGEREKAVYHLKATLGITSRFGWNGWLSFMAHHALAAVFCLEGKFGDAHAHVEQAKPHAVNNTYRQGQAAFMQAMIYYKQHRLEDAMSEALRALGIFEELGNLDQIEECRNFLEDIKGATKSPDNSAVSTWVSWNDAVSRTH